MEAIMKNKKFEYFDFNKIFNYQRGKRYKKQNHIPGNIAYISSTYFNNGIANYVSPPDDMKVYKNKLTLSNSGSVCFLFYHDYEFVASDHVTVIWLKNKELNKYIALYLKPVFEQLRSRYNFGREIKNPRLEAEKIYLPIDSNGKPDWVYMESYIKSIEHKVVFNNIYTKNKRQQQTINLCNWKEFNLTSILSFQKGTKVNDIRTREEMVLGDTQVISSSQYNNGVAGFTFVKNEEIFTNALTLNKNGSIGYTFYHENDFIATGDVAVLKLNGDVQLNRYIALFLKTIIEKHKYKYEYGRKFNEKRIQATKLLLPATPDGSPNWNFMENYIKNLPYGDLI